MNNNGKLKIKVKTCAFEELMARRNYNQKKLANLVQRTATHISLVKSNKKSASPKLRKLILEALDAEFEDIFITERSP